MTGTRGNPDRRVTAIDFVDELGCGLMLNGNQLTILTKARLVATQSPEGPIPALTRVGLVKEVIYRHAYRHHEGTGQLFYLWAFRDLASGDYELESTIRIRKRGSAIWENLYGQIRFKVEFGALARIYLTPTYHEPPIDLSAEALRRRAEEIIKGAPADER